MKRSLRLVLITTSFDEDLYLKPGPKKLKDQQCSLLMNPFWARETVYTFGGVCVRFYYPLLPKTVGSLRCIIRMYISIDIETTGLDPINSSICSQVEIILVSHKRYSGNA